MKIKTFLWYRKVQNTFPYHCENCIRLLPKAIFLLLALLALYSVSMALAAEEKTEEITLTTYYPAPYGDYDELTVTNDAIVGYLIVEPQDAGREGGEIRLEGAGSYADWQLDNFAGRFRLHSGGGEKFTVTTAGNVGIGLDDPNNKLNIFGGGITLGKYLTSFSNPQTHAIQFLAPCGNLSNVMSLGGRIYASNPHVSGITPSPKFHLDAATGAAGSSYLNNQLVLSGTGNVGIGTVNPTQKLHVEGNLLVTGGVYTAGGTSLSCKRGNRISFDWGVFGGPHDLDFYIDDIHVLRLNASDPWPKVKSFVIDHPVDQSKYLVHATLEGPEGAVYYRGTASLENGITEVMLPDYFEALTRDNDRTIILTNVDGFDRLMVKKIDGNQINNGRFTIISDIPDSNQEFNWEVKAVRADVLPLAVEPSKDSVDVRGDGPYTYLVSKE